MSKKVLVIQSEGLGKGDDKLGAAIMAKFFSVLAESKDKPAALMFWNAGVKLLGDNSPVLDSLKKLEKQGVEITACTTCLEHFDLLDKINVGSPTTMGKAVQAILVSEVVTL
jgi:selenium metabolism protein YedF